MTAKELIEQLRLINQERIFGALYDDAFFLESHDVDALNSVIILMNYLSTKKPSDKVTIAEIFDMADIEYKD